MIPRIVKNNNDKTREICSFYYIPHQILLEVEYCFDYYLADYLSLKIEQFDHIIDVLGTKYKNHLKFIRSNLERFINIMTDIREFLLVKSRQFDELKREAAQIHSVLMNAMYFILFIDGLLYGKIPKNLILNEMIQTYTCSEILNIFINDMAKLFMDNDMFDVLDNNYKSLIDISDNGNEECETFPVLLNRTSKLCKIILTDINYVDSIYVSHSSVINTIIVNIFKNVYGDSYLTMLNEKFSTSCEDYESFCKSNTIKMGSILEISIVNATDTTIRFIDIIRS